MTETEADECLAQYRSLLKRWTMCITGLEDGNAEAISQRLHEDENLLNEIATTFPAKAYSVDLLVNARTRTWAGYEDERVQRVMEVVAS